MFRTILAATLIALALPVFAEETASENLFQKGLAAYQNKQFAEARDLFQKLIEQKVISAPLLHNLALAEYQLDQKPLALALWRKALSIDPHFRAARLSRDFAENKMQVRGWENDPIRGSINRGLEFISFYEALWMIALLLGVAGWLWLRYWAERRFALEEERPLPSFPTAAITLSLIFLICLVLVAAKTQQTFRTRATVVLNKANARSLPSEDGVGLFELNGGAEVIVRRQDGDWAQVQNSVGQSGWLRKDELFITSGR